MTIFWIIVFCAWTILGAMALIYFGDFLSPDNGKKLSAVTAFVYALPILIITSSLDNSLKELQTRCITAGVAKLVTGSHQFQPVKFEFIGIPAERKLGKGAENAQTATDTSRIAEQGPGPAFD